jgi:type I restriction-modification system DNA methylase subunit
VLFSHGQEKRLREDLLHRGGELNELHSVVSLPSGAFSATGLAAALVTLTPSHNNNEVLMVDLGMSRRALGDIDELVRSSRDIALGQVEDENRACKVTREDIIANEYSFAPFRYLRKKVDVGANAQPLESLCELIRPPFLSKDDDIKECLEIGISDLKEWREVSSKLEKVVKVRVRKEMPTLKSGDLVLSIKGTIGKVGLVAPPESDLVVVSQICLGIRIKPDRYEQVSPQYLFMYLRSAAGQAQLLSLQAGAAIQHISPQTLLSSFLVPVPQAHERTEVENDYQRLCQLEQQVANIQKQMQEITELRWTV